MSAVIQPSRAVTAPTEAAPSIRGPWMFAAAVGILAGLLFGVYRWYQQNYSFTVGMDYFEPEFQTYWMSLFYVQMTVIPLVGAVALAVLWFTRDRNVMSITPQEELKRYYYVLTLLAVASILAAVIFGLFVEADAAWHQTTVRDTDFTPTHIALFYFAIPAALVGLTFAWMWVHTRLPEFTQARFRPVVAGGGRTHSDHAQPGIQ